MRLGSRGPASANCALLTYLCLCDVRLSATGKEQLAKLAKLKDVEFMPADDEDIAALARLPALRNLQLTCERLTKKGKARIGSLTSLETLVVYDAVDDDFAAALGCLANLKKLYLYDAHITDAGMAHVGKPRSLTTLSICDNLMTDIGVRSIEKLENLEDLSIEGENLSGAAAAYLQPLLKLKILDFPVLDEEAAVNLARLQRLTSLGVHLESEGDDQRLKRLRRALPNCNVLVGSGRPVDSNGDFTNRQPTTRAVNGSTTRSAQSTPAVLTATKSPR